jgi:hypothetical protein
VQPFVTDTFASFRTQDDVGQSTFSALGQQPVLMNPAFNNTAPPLTQGA